MKIKRLEKSENEVVFSIIRKDKTSGEVSLFGSEYDLINALACVCDIKEIRDMLRAAVALDIIHDQKVGRRYDDYWNH